MTGVVTPLFAGRVVLHSKVFQTEPHRKEGSELKKISALLMAATIASSLLVISAGPASASDGSPAAGAFVFSCTANLPEWPSPGNSGNCNNLVSAGAGVHGTTPFTATSLNATFDYNEPCVLAEPPVAGFANGTATLGAAEVDFSWVRVGLVAVITTGAPRFGHDHTGAGAGVAAFAPLPPLGTCAAPAPLTAIVAGVGAAAGV